MRRRRGEFLVLANAFVFISPAPFRRPLVTLLCSQVCWRSSREWRRRPWPGSCCPDTRDWWGWCLRGSDNHQSVNLECNFFAGGVDEDVDATLHWSDETNGQTHKGSWVLDYYDYYHHPYYSLRGRKHTIVRVSVDFRWMSSCESMIVVDFCFPNVKKQFSGAIERIKDGEDGEDVACK